MKITDKLSGTAVKILYTVLALLGVLLLILLVVFMLRKDREPAISDPVPSQSTKQTTAPTETTEASEEVSQVTTAPVEPETVETTEKETEPAPTTSGGNNGGQSGGGGNASTVPTAPVDNSLKLPYQIPGYDLVIRQVDAYDGLYLEDGSNEDISGVAMMLLENTGADGIGYVEVTLHFANNETRRFKASTIPAGSSLVVQDADRKPMPQGKLLRTEVMIAEDNPLSTSDSRLLVTENDDNSITVKNLTDQEIPVVRIFFKYYMKDENVFVGGITFTAKILNLAADSEITIRPEHYSSDSSQVVGVSVYDSAQ